MISTVYVGAFGASAKPYKIRTRMEKRVPSPFSGRDGRRSGRVRGLPREIGTIIAPVHKELNDGNYGA
jgi:hypothetical protein